MEIEKLHQLLQEIKKCSDEPNFQLELIHKNLIDKFDQWETILTDRQHLVNEQSKRENLFKDYQNQYKQIQHVLSQKQWQLLELQDQKKLLKDLNYQKLQQIKFLEQSSNNSEQISFQQTNPDKNDDNQLKQQNQLNNIQNFVCQKQNLKNMENNKKNQENDINFLNTQKDQCLNKNTTKQLKINNEKTNNNSIQKMIIDLEEKERLSNKLQKAFEQKYDALKNFQQINGKIYNFNCYVCSYLKKSIIKQNYSQITQQILDVQTKKIMQREQEYMQKIKQFNQQRESYYKNQYDTLKQQKSTEKERLLKLKKQELEILKNQFNKQQINNFSNISTNKQVFLHLNNNYDIKGFPQISQSSVGTNQNQTTIIQSNNLDMDYFESMKLNQKSQNIQESHIEWVYNSNDFKVNWESLNQKNQNIKSLKNISTEQNTNLINQQKQNDNDCNVSLSQENLNHDELIKNYQSEIDELVISQIFFDENSNSEIDRGYHKKLNFYESLSQY